jgi:protein arginine N-methyltransferase 1
MYPDKAQMFLAPLEDRIFKEEKVNFWKSVDGFDYSPVYDLAAQEPQIGIVDSE